MYIRSLSSQPLFFRRLGTLGAALRVFANVCTKFGEAKHRQRELRQGCGCGFGFSHVQFVKGHGFDTPIIRPALDKIRAIL